MTDAHRHPGPGPVAASPGLGRELLRFGSLGSSRGGWTLRMLFVLTVVFLVLMLGTIAVLVIAGIALEDPALAITGIIVGGFGSIMFGLLALIAHGTLRSTLVLHENGLVANQGFRAPLVLAWAEVEALVPWQRGVWRKPFYIRLHTGRMVELARLKVVSREDAQGTWIPHPDIALVLEHYTAWCHRHGRPVVIRPKRSPGD